MTARTRKVKKVATDLAGECLAMRSRLISRTITGIYDEALRPVGVTVGQLSILAVVVRHDPLSPGEVAGLLSIEKSTMSRNVARMKRNGWLVIGTGESARIQELGITEAGRKILEEAAPHWRAAQRRVGDMVGLDGIEAIHQLADVIREQSTG
jgi:DNA-binding MarR family transcriptional regulator